MVGPVSRVAHPAEGEGLDGEVDDDVIDADGSGRGGVQDVLPDLSLVSEDVEAQRFFLR